jgi:hypothetical protein
MHFPGNLYPIILSFSALFPKGASKVRETLFCDDPYFNPIATAEPNFGTAGRSRRPRFSKHHMQKISPEALSPVFGVQDLLEECESRS